MTIDMKMLKKKAKALNKLGLLEDPLELDQDFETLSDDFVDSMVEIDDDGKLDQVPTGLVEFHEKLLKQVDSDNVTDEIKEKELQDTLEDALDELEELDEIEELEEFVEEYEIDFDIDGDEEVEDLKDKIIKIIRGGSSKGDDDKELDQIESKKAKLKKKLKKMDFRELKNYVRENELEVKVKKKKMDEAIEAIVETTIGEPAKKSSKEKSTKEATKEKSTKEEKKYPKGIKVGGLPAKTYDMIEDGGTTIGEIAIMIADQKGTTAEKTIGEAMRTVIRKISKAKPICAVFNGNEEGITLEFE